jgi:D-alanine-D-alanine ligase-like ATP-grasp enzyme
MNLGSKDKLAKVKGQFELLGCDIMIDSNLKPILIELNTNPALHTSTTVLF